MNALAIPVPVDATGPARAKVTTLPDGSWTLAWAREGGLRVEPFGDPFEKVADACRMAEAINARSDS